MRLKAQGAVEYLLIIATSLVLVFLVISRTIHPQSGHVTEMGKMSDLSGIQSKVELIAQKYNSSEWWGQYGNLYQRCMRGEKSACEEISKDYPNG